MALFFSKISVSLYPIQFYKGMQRTLHCLNLTLTGAFVKTIELGVIASEVLITEAFSEDALLFWRPWRQRTNYPSMCIPAVVVMG